MMNPTYVIIITIITITYDLSTVGGGLVIYIPSCGYIQLNKTQSFASLVDENGTTVRVEGVKNATFNIPVINATEEWNLEITLSRDINNFITNSATVSGEKNKFNLHSLPTNNKQNSSSRLRIPFSMEFTDTDDVEITNIDFNQVSICTNNGPKIFPWVEDHYNIPPSAYF